MVHLTLEETAAGSIDADPPDWRGPETCPFCGAKLADGGPAFVAHVERSGPCRAGFLAWRDRVADDVRAEWIG